jgi:hypothetical protein
MNTKPSIGFLTKDGQAPFTDKVTAILQKMTGNAAYPSPLPTLATVETAFDAYKVAAANAVKGGVQATLARDARRSELVSLLWQLASYVSATANGDPETLISSGFPAQKPGRAPVGPLPAPDAPVISQGPRSGVLKAVTAPVRGASSYNWSLSLESDPDTDVQTAQTTGARAAFSGLTPGKVYLICLNAVGSAGTSDWSDFGSLMVI